MPSKLKNELEKTETVFNNIKIKNAEQNHHISKM